MSFIYNAITFEIQKTKHKDKGFGFRHLYTDLTLKCIYIVIFILKAETLLTSFAQIWIFQMSDIGPRERERAVFKNFNTGNVVMFDSV